MIVQAKADWALVCFRTGVALDAQRLGYQTILSCPIRKVITWCVTKKIKLDLNPAELQALTTLAENQFFRMRYIDPKLPGYHIEQEVFRASQSAVSLLSEALKKEKGLPMKAAAGSNN